MKNIYNIEVIKFLENEIRKQEIKIIKGKVFINFRLKKISWLEKVLFDRYLVLEKMVEEENQK